MRQNPALFPRRRRRATAAAAVILTGAAIFGGTAAHAATTTASVASHTGSGSVFEKFSLTVRAGQTVVVSRTRLLLSLTIEQGGHLVAPDGSALTITVNGVETGQVITPTGATATTVTPGAYRGMVVLAVTPQTPVEYNGLTYQFREGLYVGPDGVDRARSVRSAAWGLTSDTTAVGLRIRSTGEAFNGVVVDDADYTLVKPRITMDGNGRSDFAGMGAGIVGSGADTRLVVDGARISNTGVTRPALIATDGANVITMNSTIETHDGVLPADYVSTVDLSYMQSAPWMLGISGNNRATNLLGEDTQSTFISSSITSENWGALSVDTGQDTKLTAIDSVIANSGQDGYGSYVIGDATERFLGDTFDVATYAAIVRGGSVVYADSTAEAVAALDEELGLDLSSTQLAAIDSRPTTISSDRFGVMWHGSGSVDISGGTTISTQETMFLDKGQQAVVTVDGSQGATLDAANGVLYQLMDDDDPGPVPVQNPAPGTPGLTNTGVYTEPTGPVTRDAAHDVTTPLATDAVTTFTDVDLTGDLYNAMRGDQGGMFGPAQPRNLVLDLVGASLTGVVSASTAAHDIPVITAAEYRELGVVTNTPSPVVNNGVIVSLTGGSTWTVTGTSYLSSLAVEDGSTLDGGDGVAPVLTVDGVVTPLATGVTYTGNVVLTLP